MNMKLKKVLDDIQKTEEKIAELQKHLKKQNDLKQQMEDIEIIKSFRSLKLDSRERGFRQTVGNSIRIPERYAAF